MTGRSAIRLIDVALEAGTCRSTASKVLLGGGGKNTRVSDVTAERLRKAAERLGFRPNQIARQLKGIPSKMLGVLVGPETNYVNNRRLQAIEDQAYKRGYKLVVGYVRADISRFEEYLAEYESRGIEGVISLCHFSEAQMLGALSMIERIKKRVFLDELSVPNASCVIVDRGSGIREAVEHLYASGRRRIGLVLSDLKYITMVQRRKGYMEGMKCIGLEVDPRLVYVAGECHGILGHEMIDAQINELVVGAKADAMIMPDDKWAAHIMKGLKRGGFRVPEDVAIVGFDNNIDIVTAVDPELTSIDQQIDFVATRVVDMVIDQSSDQRSFHTEVIPSKLVIRASG